MQNYLPKIKDLSHRKRTKRMEIGDCGELYCIQNLACHSCNKQDFINLNDLNINTAGVDIQCRQCGEYGQVKTFQEHSNGTSPITLTCKNDLWWDDVIIPSFTNTLKNTLIQYNNNIRYYCIVYKNTAYGKKVQYIAITECLTLKNLCNRKKAIRSKHTNWIYPV